MRPTTERCTKHRAPAGWVCLECHRNLCPDCVAEQVANPIVIIRCLECRGHARPLTRRKNENQTFVSRLVRDLTYAFRLPGILVLAGLTVASGATAMFCGGRWVAMAVVVATAFALVRSASNGSDHIEVPFTNIFDDLVMPAFRFGAAMLPLWGPQVVFGDQLPGWARFVFDAVALVWAPFSFIAAATHSPILAMLNPLTILSVFRQIGRDAVTYVVFSWALFAFGGILALPVSAMMNGPAAPSIARSLIALALMLWPIVIYARVAGLLVLLHPEPFGGVAEDGLEPVLGQTAPHGKWGEAAGNAGDVAEPQPGAYRGSSSSVFSVSSSSGLRGAPIDPASTFLQALAAKDIDALAAVALNAPAGLSIKEYLQAGRLLAAHKRDPQAEPLLELAAKGEGAANDQAEARVIWARFLAERSGSPELAKEWFQHVVTHFPTTAAATFAKRWLDAHPS